jgi:sugar phosphate isomerase/epimerase
MQKMKAGITGFIPRGDDFFKTLESYAKMGYKAFEGAARLFSLDGDPKEHAKRVRGMGLELITLAANIQNGNQPDAGELIKKARLVNMSRVTIYHSSATAWRFADRPELPGREEMMKEIETIDKLGKELAKEGITLVFHNHDQEFISCYNGIPLFWLIAANCENLKFETDLGWIKYAGWDPAQLISQLCSRVASLHVKDYIPGENFEYKPHKTFVVPCYCAPGAGVVDLYACFKAACEADVEWAIIEQDMQYQLTHTESVQAAYYNMKETGFVV